MPNIYDVAAVSREFADVLREWLTPQEWAKMAERNRSPDYQGGICASHDFCDANMAMVEAFETVMGREFNGDATEADFALWNAAWNHAHKGALRTNAETV